MLPRLGTELSELFPSLHMIYFHHIDIIFLLEAIFHFIYVRKKTNLFIRAKILNKYKNFLYELKKKKVLKHYTTMGAQKVSSEKQVILERTVVNTKNRRKHSLNVLIDDGAV